MKARGKPFDTLLWKVDGSLALREAITLCYKDSTPEVAMDYFHLMYGVRNQKSSLGTHYGNVCYHIRLLAETMDEYISRAIQAVLNYWRSNGLAVFAAYFEATWIEKRRGWWCTSLGPGTPRTTAGTEGRWPHIHNWVGGKSMKEDRLIRQIVEIVLPHLTRTRKSIGPYKERCFNTYVACELAVSDNDRLKSREVEGVTKYFCHRRLLGDSRPIITNDVIDTYIQLMDNEVWTFSTVYGLL